MTSVTSRELETLLQLACFHYLTAAEVEAFQASIAAAHAIAQ